MPVLSHFFITSSSVLLHFYTNSSSILYQFFINSSSILHQFFINSSSILHHFFITPLSFLHQFFISSSSVIHQLPISSSLVVTNNDNVVQNLIQFLVQNSHSLLLSSSSGSFDHRCGYIFCIKNKLALKWSEILLFSKSDYRISRIFIFRLWNLLQEFKKVDRNFLSTNSR